MKNTMVCKEIDIGTSYIDVRPDIVTDEYEGYDEMPDI